MVEYWSVLSDEIPPGWWWKPMNRCSSIGTHYDELAVYFHKETAEMMTHYKVLLLLKPDEAGDKAGKAPDVLVEWVGFAPNEQVAIVVAAAQMDEDVCEAITETPGRLAVAVKPF